MLVTTRWYSSDSDFVNIGDHYCTIPLKFPNMAFASSVSTTSSFTLNKNIIYGSFPLNTELIDVLMCREDYSVGIDVHCFLIGY